LAFDVAPLAIERANAKLDGHGLGCRFAALDFLTDFLTTSPANDSVASCGPFQFVFDRGCFHVFDEPEERARFAARVAATLVPGGLWLSLIGSTEGEPREMGPPQRSAREIALAIEPALEIVELLPPSSAITAPGRGSASRVGGSKAVASDW